jgi:hypothetical protein
MISDSMIHMRSFMKIGTSVQAILKFCLHNLRGSNVDIADGSESAPFRNVIKFG